MISTQIDDAQKALKRLRENGKKTGSLKFAKSNMVKNHKFARNILDSGWAHS